ncbi:MAG: DoxX family protein [Planctomycetes bacterium]|nr:DoxX family protein [Planctomycetota bacterium]
MFLLILTFLLIPALILIWVSLDLTRKNDAETASGWNLGTRYFLVLLRLAIGWHFLVEGLDKVGSATWSSEVYLREATGPLAPLFRNLAGDPLVDRLSVGPDRSFPPQLGIDWDNYLAAFTAQFELDEAQQKLAATSMEQARSKTLTWLTTDKQMVARPLAQGMTIAAAMTVPERIDDLKNKEALAEAIELNERPTFGSPALPRLKEARAEARRIRTEMKSDLDKQTAAMKKSLWDLLTAEQKKDDARPPENVRRSFFQWTMREWTDNSVRYGLVAVGACLLVGLLTRTACVGGAIFLLMFYLAMPPLPGWPDNPRAEGHYLLINKNVIEMLALLALATTRSGRWAGLDGLLQFLCPSVCCPGTQPTADIRSTSDSRLPEPVIVAPGEPVHTGFTPGPHPKEISHGP